MSKRLKLALALVGEDRLSQPVAKGAGRLGQLGERAAAVGGKLGSLGAASKEVETELGKLGKQPGVIAGRLGQLSAEAQRTRAAIDQLAATQAAAQRRLGEIQGQEKQIASWKALRTQLERSKVALTEQQAVVGRLAREIHASGVPTKAQARAFEGARTAAQRLKASQNELRDAVEQARRRLHAAGVPTKNLADAERRLADEAARVGDSLQEQERHARSLREELDRQRQTAGRLGEAQTRLGRIADQGKKMVLAGAGVAAAGIGAGALASSMRQLGASILDPLLRLEQAAARVRSMPGLAEESVQKIVGLGKEWSKVHSDTAEDYVNTSYEMLSAGLDVEAAIAATETAMRVSKATGGNAAEVAKTLAQTYNNLADKSKPAAQEIARIGDALTSVQQTYLISNFDAIGGGMKYAAGAAARSRIPFEQAAAALGTLNNAGLEGEQAGTAFDAMVGQMIGAQKKLHFSLVKTSDGGLDLVGSLEALSHKIGPIDRLSDRMKLKLKAAFGDAGERAVTAMLLNMEKVKEGMKGISESKGAAQKGQEKIEAGPLEEAQIMRNQLDLLKMEVAQQLLPMLKEAIPVIKEFVQGIGDFIREHPGITQTALKIGLWGTVGMTVLSPVLKLAGGLWSLAGFARLAFVWLGQHQVLGKLASAVTAPWRAVRSLGNVFSAAGSWMGRLGRGVLGLAGRFGTMVAAVGRAGLAFMATPVGMLTTALLGLGGAIAYVVTRWDELTGQTGSVVENLDENMINAIKNDANFRKGMIQDALEGGAGSAGKRQILRQVLGDSALEDLFKAADAKRAADKRDALFKEYGLQPANDGAGMVPPELEAQLKAFAKDGGAQGDPGDGLDGEAPFDAGATGGDLMPPWMTMSLPQESAPPPAMTADTPVPVSIPDLRELPAGPSTNVTNNVTVNVVAAEGQDIKSLAKAVAKELERELRKLSRGDLVGAPT